MTGTAVPGPGNINDVGVVLANQPVEMRVDEILSRRSPPMPEQARLDVLGAQRLAQQRIRHQVDLPDGQVVGGAPVRVDKRKLLVG